MTSSYIFLNSIPSFARVNESDNVFMIGHSRVDFMRRHNTSQVEHSHVMLFEVTFDKLNDVYSRVLMEFAKKFENVSLHGPCYFRGDKYKMISLLATFIP
jgi:hypothetical protein